MTIYLFYEDISNFIFYGDIFLFFVSNHLTADCSITVNVKLWESLPGLNSIGPFIIIKIIMIIHNKYFKYH